MLNISFSNKTQCLRNFVGFFLFYWFGPSPNIFKLGSESIRIMNNRNALHYSRK